MMTVEELKNEINYARNSKNPIWRDGQFVFNYIEQNYGIVGREVQFIDKVDCFHNDENIDKFLEKCVDRLNGYLKIVSISDLHGDLPEELPNGDILIICGDILPLKLQRDYESSIVWMVTKFLPWTDHMQELYGFRKIIFIGGNHDFALQKLSSLLLDKLDYECKYPDVIYLEDETYSYKGINFYGTPWCKDLSRWAFYLNNDNLKKQFERIPENTDILITHLPPKYETCGTVLQNTSYNHLSDYGSQELMDVINDRPNLKYCFFGHVHSGNHNISTNQNGTKLVNVSLKDEDYKVSYKPLTIEYHVK